MKTWIIGLILLFSLAALTGCAKSMQYTGKSNAWSVECSINPTSKQKTYAIKYIGKGNQPVSNVQYSFENSSNFKYKGNGGSPSKNLRISGKSTLDSPYVKENGFTLYIKWNNTEEEIQLVKS
jgi:hypothetical protein